MAFTRRGLFRGLFGTALVMLVGKQSADVSFYEASVPMVVGRSGSAITVLSPVTLGTGRADVSN